MSKSFKRTKFDASFYEDYVIDHKKQKESPKKIKRLNRALHTRNLDELLALEDDEDE